MRLLVSLVLALLFHGISVAQGRLEAVDPPGEVDPTSEHRFTSGRHAVDVAALPDGGYAISYLDRRAADHAYYDVRVQIIRSPIGLRRVDNPPVVTHSSVHVATFWGTSAVAQGGGYRRFELGVVRLTPRVANTIALRESFIFPPGSGNYADMRFYQVGDDIVGCNTSGPFRPRPLNRTELCDGLGAFDQPHNGMTTNRLIWTERTALAAIGSGEGVVIWTDGGPDFQVEEVPGPFGNRLNYRVYRRVHDVFASRFGRNGQAIGSPVRVNVTQASNQTEPDVAALVGGGFVVVWSGAGAGDNDGVFMRRFDSAGSPVGGETQVNSHDRGRQHSPRIAGLDNGGFVISWLGPDDRNNMPSLAAPDFAYTRVYSAQGQAGQIVRLPPFNLSEAPVAAMEGGGHAVAIRTGTQVSFAIRGPQQPAYAFVNSGVQITMPARARNLDVDRRSGGGFVLAWNSAGSNIEAQEFDAAGQSIGASYQIAGLTTAFQRVSVAGLTRGGIASAWNASWTPDSDFPRAWHAALRPPIDTGATVLNRPSIAPSITRPRPPRGNPGTVDVSNITDTRPGVRREIDGLIPPGGGTTAPTCVPVPIDIRFWARFDGSVGEADAIAGVSPQIVPVVANAATSIAGHSGNVANLSSRPAFLTYASPAQPWGLGTDDFTIEFWMRAPSASLQGSVYFFSTLGVAPPQEIRGVRLGATGNTIQLAMIASNTSVSVETGPVLTPGQWHHVALALDRDQPDGGRIYVDGAAVTITTNVSQPLGGTGPVTLPHGPDDFDAQPASGALNAGNLVIGRDPFFDDDDRAGFEIDEFAIYARALQASEIADLHALPKCR